MLATFIKSKLQDKLKSFFELEASSIEGLTIRNIGMKPNLIQQLSQLIKVPLILTSGSIESVRLNIPWENLLFTKKDQPISISISGIQIKAKLPTELQRDYVIAVKKKIVQKFTQEFNKKSTSRLTFLNKLKEHFLGSIEVQVKNLKIQISIQMKYSLIGVLSVEYIRFQKDTKTDKTKLEVKDISVGYRLSVQNKFLEYIINKADIAMVGEREDGREQKRLQTNNLEISFNNQNFNDIRRLVALIKWHNSFVYLPESLWQFKPGIIGEVAPKKKARYIGRIIIHRIRQNKVKQRLEILRIRREYIKLFQLFRKNPNNEIFKKNLNKMEETLDLWRIEEYRKFCLNWAREKPNTPHSMMSQKKQLMNDKKISWLSYWFPKSEQNVLNQLQNCLENTHASSNKKYFSLNIQQIKIIVSIRTASSKIPFLNLIAIDNQFRNYSFPVLKEKQQPIVETSSELAIVEQVPPPQSKSFPIQQHGQVRYSSENKFIITKMMIEYDKYAGHKGPNNQYLMNEANAGLSPKKMSEVNQDQFQDIENFFECDINEKQVQMKIVPFSIRLNEDTLQKLSVFKVERIHNTFESAQKLVFEENTFEEEKSRKKQSKPMNIKTSVYLSVPENMYEEESEQISLSLVDIIFTKRDSSLDLKIDNVSLNASLLIKQEPKNVVNPVNRMMQQADQKLIEHFMKIQLLRTSVGMRKYDQSAALQIFHWNISSIKIELTSTAYLRELIRLISKLQPKNKNKKPIYKLKNLRRKQSIGQQFIDACQNLQEHLIRSATFSERTKHQKYIVKNRKDIQTIIEIQSIKIVCEASQLQISKCTLTIFQFIDYKSILLNQQQKNITIRIFNIKNFIKNVRDISKEIERLFELKSKQAEQNQRVAQSESDNDMLTINDINILIEVYNEDKPKFVIEISNIIFEILRDQSIKAQMTFGFAYYRTLLQKIKRVPQEKEIREQIIESFKLYYFHEKEYNKDQKVIKITDLNWNIKPNLFLELGNLFDTLNTPQKLRIEIINSTANYVNISTTGNIYKQYGPGAIAISAIPKCDIILFGKKENLNLLPQSGLQKIELTRNLYLLKTMKTQYIFNLESNFRITNRQQNTIWIRVITNSAIYEMRKNSMKEVGLVTFEHLSTAQVDSSEDRSQKGANLKRSTSLHSRFKQDDENSDDLGMFDTKIKKVNIIRTTVNPKLPAQKDAVKEVNQSLPQMNKNPISAKSTNSDTYKDPLHPNHTISRYQSINEPLNKMKNNQQILFQPIAPQQTIQLLLSSQDYYIQIIEYDRKGDIQQKYHAFKVKQILQDNQQKLVHSYLFDCWNNRSQEREISSSLVVATTVVNEEENNMDKIYHVEILSPFVMVNKIPTQIQFRFSKEEVDMLEVITSAGQQIRKRSFQAIQLEKIEPFKISRVNKLQYNEISEVQINMKGYIKVFRLDHIVQNIKQLEKDIDIRITDLLCLNNGSHEIQMGIQIRILKNIMKITVFPQFIFVNMTSLNMNLQIQQQNYNYAPIKMQPLKDHNHFKMYIRMSNEKLCNYKVLQHMFKEYENNINTFTGSFDQKILRSVRYGNEGNYHNTRLFNTYEDLQKLRQKVIIYGEKQNRLVARKIKIDDKPIYLLLFMPSLFVINKSDWSFFIKREGEEPKKLYKNSIEYMLINDSFAVQACEEQDEIAYGQWMKISLNTLGTIYYAKQMTSSSGYESKEYQLRKKRLKKVPKLFFRIVMTKYQYGHQILIEESQYPPVSFISRCKSRVQVRELTQNIFQQMEMNQIAQYASKTPHHNPTFALAMVQNYEFRKLGQFSIEEPNSQKILKNHVKISVEQYKDKKIVIIEDYLHEDKSKFRSVLKNQFLLEKVQKMIVLINRVQISILSGSNKQLSCACIKDIEFNHESKNAKKYMKLNIGNAEILSYNGLQPRYLFYCKQPITKTEVLGIFKRKPQPQNSINLSNHLGSSIGNVNSSLTSIQYPPPSSLNSSTTRPILSLDLTIDYHKHATILQKFKVAISQLVVVLNANTIIDYFKYYYRDFCELMSMIRKHEFGRMILRQIDQAFNPSNENKVNKYDNSISINNLNSNNIPNNDGNETGSSPKIPKGHHKVQHRNSVESNNYYNVSLNSNSDDNVDLMNRAFVIQNFNWQGLKITIKFQNLQNLQYFMNNKEIKYLIKFINWIGDLRPIQFSPTQVQYEQYTIMKLIQLIDLNKLMKEIYQTFLQYPLQEFYHIMSFITKFVGLNDLEESYEQWNTLKKIGKSAFKVTRRIFSLNSSSPTYIIDENGQMKENKNYVQKFVQENINDNDIIEKILKFKYEEWRYKEEAGQNKLNLKVQRLERYSPPLQLIPYQAYRARIQTAINNHCGNKLFREIMRIQPINKQTIIGITEDWFVLYMIDKEQWIVTKPEQVLQLRIQKIKNNKVSLGLGFTSNSSTRQLIVIVSAQNQGIGKLLKIQKYFFNKLTATQTEIEEVQEYLNGLKLSNIY